MDVIAVSLADEAPAPRQGAAIALGNLDGVHLGHQAVLAAARTPGLALAAAIFEPHPRRLFQPDAPPFRLQSPAQRARALSSLGVEILYQIGFDRALAGLTDAAFCEAILKDRLGAALAAVGEDFCFGKGRMGDAAALQRHGQRLGFEARIAAPVEDAASRGKVSSTAIREALGAGDPAAAARLLSRPFAIEGAVGPGAQRGRTIGFPTANIALGEYVRPRFGVYAVQIDVGDGVARPGVANLGVKPTVGGAPEPLLEAHLFDFTGDLYGRRVEVALIGFLREERRFDGLPALLAQIKADAAHARQILSALL
jgi:riboflavin kinase/FMN adenylyltransferase